MTALGQVEPYQQIQQYSCGAAALKAVLQHWGEDHDEPMLIDLIGVDPNRGSTVEQVATAARKLGYQARPHQFGSLAELRAFTSRDIPVIVAVRSFNRPNQGHFVVAVHVDDDRIEIMDPNTPGNWRVISPAEMDRRWQYRDRYAVLVLPRGHAGLGASMRENPSSWGPLALAGGGALALGAALWFTRSPRR